MFQITDSHIDFILDDLRIRGIVTEDLRDNIVDHVCVLIEETLEEGGDFESCYSRTISQFYKEALSEIETETAYLLTHGECWVLLGRMPFFWLLFSLLIGPIIVWTLISLLCLGVAPDGLQIATAWEAAFVYSLFPLGSLLVLFFTPRRFDPLLPRGSMIRIGRRPFIEIIPA